MKIDESSVMFFEEEWFALFWRIQGHCTI